MELKRLDERVGEILEESGPAEVEFLLAEFVEDDEVLHGAIARGVYAVEEPEVHAGLDGLDKAVADDVDDPVNRVGELAFAGTGEREGIADRGGEIIVQMIPRHAERSVAFAPAEDEVRASVEALVDFKSGQWPSGRDETKLPQGAAGDRLFFKRHRAETDFTSGIETDSLGHDLDDAAKIRAGEVAGENADARRRRAAACAQTPPSG